MSLITRIVAVLKKSWRQLAHWLSQPVAMLILIEDAIYLNLAHRAKGLPPPALANRRAEMLERRTRQRFPNRLPIVINTRYGQMRAIARDVSAGGVFFYVNGWPLPNLANELTMLMQLEITFHENVREMCRARVVRVETETNAGRLGIAVVIDNQ